MVEVPAFCPIVYPLFHDVSYLYSTARVLFLELEGIFLAGRDISVIKTRNSVSHKFQLINVKPTNTPAFSSFLLCSFLWTGFIY